MKKNEKKYFCGGLPKNSGKNFLQVALKILGKFLWRSPKKLWEKFCGGRTTCKKRVKIHHVLSCPQCLNSKGHKQFWHRDFNAAKNILSCYLAEAYGLERPLSLRRTK